MRIAGAYSFNRGKETIAARYPDLLIELNEVIKSVDAAKLKTKISAEKTMVGRKLYSPRAINVAFDKEFSVRHWKKVRVQCDYPTDYYTPEYKIRSKLAGAFREMDFVKAKLGIEVQFGKYAFMVYNVCAKMTIFRNLGHIDAGIEIVPIKELAEEMSTGVSYFEQIVWDLAGCGKTAVSHSII